MKIFFNYVIGPLLGAWLFYSLYKQIKTQPHFHESLYKLKTVAFSNHLWVLIAVCVMVFINWGIEARKWQILIKIIQPLSFYMAFKGVLSGVALSINTPNRIGEYGGRILFIKEGNRLKAISLSIAGSISQLIITLFMGSAGLIYLLIMSGENILYIMGLSVFWIKILLYLSIVSGIVFTLLFFRLSYLLKIIDRIPFLLKYRYFVDSLEKFDPNILLRLLSLSFFRYLIFVIQYIMMLNIFEVYVSFSAGFWAVSVLYLVLAIIPSIAIAELGIRGKFSVALLSIYSTNIIGIIGSTFGIWFINLFIPAITGSLFILSNRFFKENNVEK